MRQALQMHNPFKYHWGSDTQRAGFHWNLHHKQNIYKKWRILKGHSTDFSKSASLVIGGTAPLVKTAAQCLLWPWRSFGKSEKCNVKWCHEVISALTLNYKSLTVAHVLQTRCMEFQYLDVWPLEFQFLWQVSQTLWTCNTHNVTEVDWNDVFPT